MEKKFILEYSEEQGMFHMNDGTHPKNTNGYLTVLEDITLEEYKKFTDQIRNRKITYAYLIREAIKFIHKRK
jgi:hypothetical protein